MIKNRLALAPRVLVAAFALALLLLPAASAHAAGPPGGYSLYVVHYGDTLESIAARFGMPMQVILQANGMASPYAYIEQPLYMPSGYSAPGYGGYGSYGSSSIYVVQPGDTLSAIARRYSISTYSLMRTNYLYNPNFVFAGMRLRVPRALYSTPAYSTYVVRFGDSLSSIAVRLGTTVYALAIANNIPNPNLIFAGMRLVIPTSSTYAPPGYGSSTQPYTYPVPPSGYRAPTPVPSGAPSGNATVSIQNMMFVPSSITVHVGTLVMWKNLDSVAHTVTSGTPSAPSGMFDSGTLNPGQSFQFTFTTPGTFAYYCRIHGAAMEGTVTVMQ
jgi:LysM repeat protein/plastocyanin